LAAIAVGLGAMMPNLREQSPSKIAAGFGGTLNLVISTSYIVAVIVLTAVPCHFYVAITSAEGWVPSANADTIRFWLAAGTGASLLLGAMATAVPLMLGFRAFRRLEF
jgi:ABC-2 type transport system permease protein